LPKEVLPSVKRNLALYGDRLLVPTADSHLVALDIKTGKVISDRAIGDYSAGFRITGGPLAAKGRVIEGVEGRAPGGNYIPALDVETGQDIWRFYTIARPDEPGGNSWNGLPLEKRNGAVWTAGSYDPDLNLVYFGVAPTYDMGPLLNLVKHFRTPRPSGGARTADNSSP
jgi:alcohol dehydrogenase (cytochrome c)